MALKVRHEVRQRLAAAITEAVEKMQVEKGIYLRRGVDSPLATGDAALSPEMKKALAKVISDKPFSGFVIGTIYDELNQRFKYDDNAAAIPLTQLPGFEDSQAVATRIVDAFVSLPRSYHFVYPLPFEAGSAAPDTQYVLNDAVVVVRPGTTFNTRYKTSAGGTLASLMAGDLVLGGPSPWNSERFYIVVKTEGFNTGAFTTQTAKDVRLLIRAFGGLLEATVSVDYDRSKANTGWEAGPYFGKSHHWIYAYVGGASGWAYSPSAELDAEHGERLDGLRWFEPQSPDMMSSVCHTIRPAFELTDEGALLRNCAQWA